MMKNVYLKKLLKGTVFKGFTLLNKFVPKNDKYILLYSGNKGLSYNLVPLKEYLLDNEYNEYYKLFYGIEDMKYADSVGKNELYLPQIKAFFIFLRSKHVFYTAGQIPIKPTKDQNVLFMGHGNAYLKKVGALSKINNGDEHFFNIIQVPGEPYVDIAIRSFNCTREEVVYNTDPMLDCVFESKDTYDLGNFKKIIMWTPTFRQSDYLGYNDSKIENLLPLFDNNDYDELNSYLKDRDMKLIVKIHPMQDVAEIKQFHFSNLDIYTHDDFTKQGYDMYKMLPQIDVMLGDYSSTMMQFLLLNKPMGFVVPDIEEYKEKRGIVFDDYENYMAGNFIYTKAELYKFLDDISKEIDDSKEKRQLVRDRVFDNPNGNYTAKALELCGVKKKR